MTTLLRGRQQVGVWHLYVYPTLMPCAQSTRCPRGGDHKLYGGMSNWPEMRDTQHRDRSPWYGHRSGPMEILPTEYYSEVDAKRAESELIASGLLLANIQENEWNPCRWYFGSPRSAAVAVRPRRRLVTRTRSGRLRVALRVKVAIVLVVWLATALGVWSAVANRYPGMTGAKLGAVTATVALVLAWWRRPRRRRRR